MDEARWSDFKSRFEAQAADAEAVTRLTVEAITYTEEDPALAEQALAVVLSKRMLVEAPGTPSGFKLLARDALVRLQKDRNIARSYAGGTPQGRYEDFRRDALRIELDRSYSPRAQGVDYPQPGEAKFFVRCSGASSPRPVSLALNKSGQWKVTQWESLAVSVKPPVDDKDF